MKKIVFSTLLICMLVITSVVFATNLPTNNNSGYDFNIKYEGEIKKNVPKDGIVTLTGTEATPYTNVRVEAEQLSGPATATVYAYDENGNKFDITNTNAWGPTSGFAVGGTFTNETPITATYPETGTYVTKLSLIDLKNSNAEIYSEEFTVTVTEDVIQNNVVESVVNNTITQMPQTGVSIWTYLSIIAIVIIAFLCLRKLMNKSK